MSQPLLRDPIVSTSIVRTGTGNGNVSVDKLTHFTTAQTYTLTCISKTPDTIFSVSGSADGPVGIATVGTQFFDEDLKIFLTITQGSTVFEVGDQFTFSVINGTDLNQDNIDDYDELPQKNFGVGVKGSSSGDHSMRFRNTYEAAKLFLDGILYTAVTPGPTGNAIQVAYVNPVAGTVATGTLQGLNFTSLAANAAANGITVEFIQSIAAAKAEVTIQNVNYQAITPGTGGNSITVAYTTGATAGAEVVSVVGNAISVQIASGVSTPAQIVSKVNAHFVASSLVFAKVTPAPSTTPQTGPVSTTPLTGGVNSAGTAGFEIVTVVGQAITVRCENLTSTQSQIKTALDAFPAAAALISTTVTSGATTVASPAGPASFTGGVDGIGQPGYEVATLAGNLITVYLTSDVTTYSTIKTKVDAVASSKVTTTLVGPGTHTQDGPHSAQNLVGGLKKSYTLNHDELTDPSNFFEGNAAIVVDGIDNQGDTNTDGDSYHGGSVVLNNPNSGPYIEDAQQKMNDLQDELDAHEASDTDVHGVGPGNQVVGTGTQQVLTNKDINGGTASNVNRLTLPKNTTTNLAGLTRKEATLVYDTDTHKMFYDDGTDLKAVGGGGSVKVDAYDPVSTVKPTTTASLIDGLTITNGMLVIFDALSSLPHRVWKAAVSGVSITWTQQNLYSQGPTPVVGDEVRITQGTGYTNQLGVFDGSLFRFNAPVRYFNGLDYFEQSSIVGVAIAASTTATVFSVGYIASENMIVDFSILRGSGKEVGTLHITSDGSTATVAQSGAALGSTGISFSAAIVSGNLVLSYTSNAGGTGTLKVMVRRWANGAGGPGGVPTYGVPAVGTAPAAGLNKQVQFNSGGSLAADSGFTYDQATNTVSLNGLEIQGQIGFTILDNQSSPQDMITYDASDYSFVIIEFSINRDSDRRLGRLMVTNNGSVVSLTEDFNNLGDVGVTLSAVLVGANVIIQYLSTNTGFNAGMKYSMRRWA